MSFKRIALPTLVSPSPDQFNEYLNSNQPVLIKNSLEWALVKNFSLDKIASLFGTRQYITIVSKHGFWADEATYDDPDAKYNHANSQQEERKLSMLTAKEFIDRATNPDNFSNLHFDKEIMYLISSVPNNLKEVLQPRLSFLDNIKTIPTFWMSTQGSITQTHMDTREGFLIQVMGNKKVILFDSALELYLPHLENVQENKDYIDAEEGQVKATSLMTNPELATEQQFPGLSKLEGYESILNPGDILYIPFGWWHYVRTLNFSISFNLAFNTVDLLEYAFLLELLKKIPKSYYKFLFRSIKGYT